VILAALVVLVGLPGTTVLWLRADRERSAKETALNEKETALDEANTDRLRLEDEAYAAHLALAAGALEANDVTAASAGLDHCKPLPDHRDLRGWEWYYLQRQCATDVLPGLEHGEPESAAHAVGFLPDGWRLFSAGGLILTYTFGGRGAGAVPGQLKIWDARTGSLQKEFQDHGGSVCAAVASPDGRWLASAGADGTVLLRDAATLEVVPGPPPSQPGWLGLAFAPDSRPLAIGGDQEVLLWDVVARRTRGRIPAAGNRLAFSADGRRLMIARPNASAPTLWDVATRQQLPHHIERGQVHALAFSPDGRFLALAHPEDPRIELWDAAGTRLLQEVAGHTSAVRCLAFAADGRLASGSEDRTIRVHDLTPDLALRRPTLVLRGHRLGVFAVAFSPDGKRLLSASASCPRVWIRP
jgi:WD40 repeat protein